MSDTILRQREILRLIPRSPRKKTTTDIHVSLVAMGYVYSKTVDGLWNPHPMPADANSYKHTRDPKGFLIAKMAKSIGHPMTLSKRPTRSFGIATLTL